IEIVLFECILIEIQSYEKNQNNFKNSRNISPSPPILQYPIYNEARKTHHRQHQPPLFLN
ncbi:MAG: hypothetical protein MR758_02330, partial [Bacteroidales bacterium]|nr:hypothetical protein [Bacteroidales bacterium]